MGIIIKNADTERKIRTLARRTGETLTEAVTQAVEDRLARLPAPRRRHKLDRGRISELLAKFDAMPVVDLRTPDEIIGYNERGHFD